MYIYVFYRIFFTVAILPTTAVDSSWWGTSNDFRLFFRHDLRRKVFSSQPPSPADQRFRALRTHHRRRPHTTHTSPLHSLVFPNRVVKSTAGTRRPTVSVILPRPRQSAVKVTMYNAHARARRSLLFPLLSYFVC